MDARTLFDISGKTIAITGGGGALCGAIADGLGQLGVRVALLDRNFAAAAARAESIYSEGGRAMALECDVLDAESLSAARAKIETEWGRVDFLLNGAGGNSPFGSSGESFAEPDAPDGERTDFFDIPLDGFRGTLDLNFLGTVLPSRIFGEAMARARSGAIVNISSMSAFTPLTKVVAYSAAKSAVANFTKWLAVHLSHVGVRVNALAPGFFMTEQLRFLHIDQETGEFTARARQVIAATPMGRYGEPAELVGTVVWLLSAASQFVTGAVVPIDGGFSCYSV